MDWRGSTIEIRVQNRVMNLYIAHTLGSRGFSLSEIWGRSHGRRGAGGEAELPRPKPPVTRDVGPRSPRKKNPLEAKVHWPYLSEYLDSVSQDGHPLIQLAIRGQHFGVLKSKDVVQTDVCLALEAPDVELDDGNLGSGYGQHLTVVLALLQQLGQVGDDLRTVDVFFLLSSYRHADIQVAAFEAEAVPWRAEQMQLGLWRDDQ